MGGGGFPVEPAIRCGLSEAADDALSELGDGDGELRPIPPTARCDGRLRQDPLTLTGRIADGFAWRLPVPVDARHWGRRHAWSADVWKYWAELRAGNITQDDWCEIEQGIARSPGHCMTTGTASTMTSAAEALGLTLPGAASIPAADSRHARMAAQTGKRIVDMVWEDLKPSDVLTAAAFRNAVITVLAIGGSTNAAIHLISMARRRGSPLDDFDALARQTPCWRFAHVRPVLEISTT